MCGDGHEVSAAGEPPPRTPPQSPSRRRRPARARTPSRRPTRTRRPGDLRQRTPPRTLRGARTPGRRPTRPVGLRPGPNRPRAAPPPRHGLGRSDPPGEKPASGQILGHALRQPPRNKSGTSPGAGRNFEGVTLTPSPSPALTGSPRRIADALAEAQRVHRGPMALAEAR